MPTYQIEHKADSDTWLFKSKKYRVTATRAKGHVYVVVSGPGVEGRFTRKGLTAIHDRVNSFEMKVILLHFARQARLFSANMPTIQYVNYADIFGSCFS